MKLLLDQNLPRRLVFAIADAFPGSQHVAQVGLERADDRRARECACRHGYAVASRDSDFLHLALWSTSAGKFVYLRTGSCSTHRLQDLLTSHTSDVRDFLADPAAWVLTLA